MVTRLCGHCGQAIPVTFGERLKRLRLDRGLTLPQVMKLTGVQDANLSRYERDKARPQVRTAKRIAEGLGVSVKWLLGFNLTDRGV